MFRFALAAAATLFAAASTSQAALIGYWTFDEGSGQTVNDSSGNGNGGYLGTAAGADGGDPAWSGSGLFGGAVNLSAGNRVTIPVGHTVKPTTALSQVGWVNLDSFTGTWGSAIQYPFNPASHANPYFETGIYINSSGGLHTRIDGTASSPVNGSTVTAGGGNWHMLAVTWNGSVARTFIDGVQVGGNLATGATITYNNNSPILFGVNASGAETIDGRLDDFGVYDHALSATEIALINGVGRLTGLTQTSSAIGDLNALFQAGSGAVGAGNVPNTYLTYQWEYATGLTGGFGAFGGSTGGGNAFIVLDGSGNGVRLTGVVPEPATGLMLLCGLVGLASRRKRSC